MSRPPAIYRAREFVDAGGLMSHGPIHRILTGARSGDLLVQPPICFDLAIDLRTARALGLAFPPSMLQRADHVVR